MTEAEKEGLAAAKEAELNEKEAPSTGASKIDMNEAKHVESSLEGKSQVEAAKWIAENAPDKDYRLIASRVAE